MQPDAEGNDFFADLEERLLNDRVNKECDVFRGTGDGRYLWRAFLLLREAGRPIPDGFLDVFADWGRRLLSAQTPREIATALDLAGSAGEQRGRRQSDSYRKQYLLATEVEQVRNLYGIKQKAAIDTVARNRKVSFSVVHKAYYATFPKPSRSRVKARREEQTRSLTAALRSWRSD